MGCGPSKGTDEEIARDRKIGKELRRDFSRDAQIVKLLLLGAGESGKSTIVKQMKLLHPVGNRKNSGFSDEEKLEAKIQIYKNILDSILQLLEALTVFGLSLGSAELERDQYLVTTFNNSERQKSSSISQECQPEELAKQMSNDPSISQAISRLWNSKAIKDCYSRRNELQLSDNTEFFLNSIDRICKPDFSPTQQDVLYTRAQTNTVSKIEFEYKKTVFNMYDVGGQRTERKKWIHYFDNVTAILFVVSISEYDQVLVEDRLTNRMHESLNLFDEHVNNKFLDRKNFILFFNKTDLFESKIVNKNITTAFPDYDGPQIAKDASDFIIKQYLARNRTSRSKRQLYPHMTTATDTELVARVFNSVAEIILNDILSETGLN